MMASPPPAKPAPARPMHRQDMAFLPAVMEIETTPPSPIGRAVLWCICGGLVLVLIWAMMAQIDIHATATGRVVPSGRVKQVQPFEAGVVQAIQVADGDLVAAGAVLVALDPADAVADVASFRSQVQNTSLTIARLRAGLAMVEAGQPIADNLADVFALTVASAEGRADQASLLASEARTIRAKLASNRANAERLRSQRDGEQMQVRRLEQIIPLARQRLQAREELAARGNAPKLQVLDLQQDLIEVERELDERRHRITEIDAALRATEQDRLHAAHEFRQTVLRELTRSSTELATLEQELAKATLRAERRLLRAPIAGRVHQLAVTTVGGVVMAGQTVAIIVPEEARLEVEAFIAAADIGFVQEGQPAAVKLDAYPFTRFGLIEGTLSHVATDSVAMQPGTAAPASTASGPPNPGEMGPAFYPARISLPTNHLRSLQGTELALAAGMTAQIEVRTGRRTVIDYLLSPVAKAVDEGLTER